MDKSSVMFLESYFLHRRNSKITCKITGDRHRSEIRGPASTSEGKRNHIEKNHIEKLMTVLHVASKETEYK